MMMKRHGFNNIAAGCNKQDNFHACTLSLVCNMHLFDNAHILDYTPIAGLFEVCVAVPFNEYFFLPTHTYSLNKLFKK